MTRLLSIAIVLAAACCLAADAYKGPLLTWKDNSANEDGFRVWRRPAEGSSWVLAATVGRDVTSYRDMGAPRWERSVYRVSAFNAAGESGYTNEADWMPPPPAAPGRPAFDGYR